MEVIIDSVDSISRDEVDTLHCASNLTSHHAAPCIYIWSIALAEVLLSFNEFSPTLSMSFLDTVSMSFLATVSMSFLARVSMSFLTRFMLVLATAIFRSTIKRGFSVKDLFMRILPYKFVSYHSAYLVFLLLM